MNPCPILRVATRLRALATGILCSTAAAAFAAPGAPTGLAASPDGPDALLTWSAPTTGDPVAFYRVYRKLPSESSWTIQDPRPAASDTFWSQAGSAHDPHRSYQYCVAAVDHAGAQGPQSNVAVYAKQRFDFVLPWDDDTTSATTDFSGWNTPIDNTDASRIYKGADGTFRVGSANGALIRFVGVNLSGPTCFPSNAEADKIAKRMAMFGVNLVRLHQMDRPVPFGLFSDAAQTSLDVTRMGRLAYFVNQLKQNGIYVDLNLHVSRTYANVDQSPSAPDDDRLRFKGVDIFSTDTGSPGMRDQQKTFAQQILTYNNAAHVPGMGTYANEPVIALIEINNEDGLLFEWAGGRLEEMAAVLPSYYGELRDKWTQWLTTEYGTDGGLAAAWSAQAAKPYGTQVLATPAPSAPAAVPGVAYTGWSLQVNSSGSAAGSAEWIDGTASGVASPAEDTVGDGIEKPTLKVHVTGQNAANKWHVQVLYSGLQNNSSLPNHLDPAATHTLRFFAKVGASDAERSIRATLRDVGGTFTHSIASLHLTRDWQEFTVVFPATGSYSGNRAFSLTDLAAQTGHVYFSGFSLTTGNAFDGQLPAVAEHSGLSSTNILTTSTSAYNFPGWTTASWDVSSSTPTPTIVTNGRSSGVDSLKFTIANSSPSGTGGYQLYRTIGSSSLEYGQTYQLQFDVKASSAAAGEPFTAGGALYGVPYTVFGSGTFQASTSWTTKTVSFTVTSAAATTRRIVFGLGAITGEIEFANIHVRKGGAVGVPTGETLAGGIAPLKKNEFYSRYRQVQTDWLRFLWKQELDYWTDMRDYVRTTLGAKALLIGTQGEMSPNFLQDEAGFDVIDAHGYWEHIDGNYTFENRSMMAEGDMSKITLTARSGRRMIGKPYLCSEYNHGSLNTHGTEGFPLIGAYSAHQGWAGMVAFDYAIFNTTTGAPEWSGGRETVFSIGQAPAKMVTLPAARAMLGLSRVGGHYVGTTERTAFASVRTATMIEKIRQTLKADIGATHFGVDPRLAMVMPIGLRRETPVATTCDIRAVPAALPSSPYVTSNGELTWDSGAQRVLIKAPLVKSALGDLPSAGSVNLDHGVTISSTAQKLQDSSGRWAAFVLTRKDDLTTLPFGANGTRWLLTTTGYSDNHAQIWAAGKGPSDTESHVTSLGTGPTLLEAVTGTLTFTVPSGCYLHARALDESGNAFGAPLTVTQSGGSATVTLPAIPLSPWYEMYVNTTP